MSLLLLMDDAFSPRSLFAAGEQGAWHDPSDFSTMFQDAAGTTPVTALGQPVGRILDKSGRGNHATQSTAASRPTLQQDSNGRYYLSFDGVDDGMVTAAIDFSSSSDIGVFFGLQNNIASDQRVIMLGAYSSQSGSFEVAIGEVISGALGVAKSNGTPNYVFETGTKSAPRLLVSYLKINAASSSSGANGIIRVNGSQVEVGAGGSGGGYAFANAAMYIGSASNGTNRLNGRIYGLIVRGAASSAGQIAATEQYMNGKTRAY